MTDKKQSCGCKLTQLIANEECSPAPAGLGNTVYFGFPDKPALKCSGTVTIDTGSSLNAISAYPYNPKRFMSIRGY